MTTTTDETAARRFARMVHGSQRYGEHLYDVHLCAVRQVLRDFGHDGDLAVAAWLHDTLEDTDTKPDDLVREFGEDVTALVWAVTGRGMNRKARNANAYEKIRALPAAAVLKVADRIANAEASAASKPDLLAMYRKEQDGFAAALRGLGVDERMWERLRRALAPAPTGAATP